MINFKGTITKASSKLNKDSDLIGTITVDFPITEELIDIMTEFAELQRIGACHVSMDKIGAGKQNYAEQLAKDKGLI